VDPPVTVDGSETVRVRALTVALDPEWVADSIRLALSREYPAQQFRLQTLKVVIPGRILISPNGTAFQPDFQHWQGKGSKMLTIDLYRGGRKFRSVPVQVEMSWEGQAPVAQRELRAGSHIEEQDIRWDKKIHQGFPFDLSLEPKSLSGMRMRLPVRAGELVHNSALLPEELVARGDLVEVTVRGKGFHVQTTALAEQPGVSGQKIRLQQTGTKRNMVGRVVGKQKVEILL
jgi:flagella basal body P-ring formation protein FlgA